MRFLHLTLSSLILSSFSSNQALEFPASASTKVLKTTAFNSTAANNVEPIATNIIYQSKDGGQTWQDISLGLPANEQPEDFFAGESDLYLHVKNIIYRSKGNLKAPVWEKENGKNWQPVQNQSGALNRVESEGVLIATGARGIMRSTDNGENWQWVISEGGVGIAVERIDGGFAVISYSSVTKSRRIRISLDKGITWKTIDEGLEPSSNISSIKQINGYLICGHPDGIYRSSDMGKTWIMVHPAVDRNAFRISTDPLRENRKVFKIYVSGNIVYAVAGSGGC